MSLQAALFRAINVGGTGKVPMADLRAAAQKAGFKQVRTLLQTGNLVFDAAGKTPAANEKRLEALCARAFALKTDIHVRTPDEIDALVAKNPFGKEAKADPSHLVVLFMRDAPDAAQFKALRAAIRGRERIEGDGRDAYLVYPDGIGDSKLTPTVIARYLGRPGTGRNWNTVLKLQAMLAS
jgi:uncharacterized protein (DUF1697 family)